MTVIPSQLLEALNGILLGLIIAMLIGAARYFVEILREVGTIRTAYIKAKAAIAISTFLFGLALRTGAIWWTRHLFNHDYDAAWLKNYASAAVIIGTGLMIWGALCWLRVTMRTGPFGWVVVAGGTIAFGVYMAL